MPLCVLVKANERQRHVFALFLHNLVLSKPSFLLQKPTKTKTFCTKFPTTQSSCYTLWLTQPKMETLADWLQPDSHSVSTPGFPCFLLLLSEGLLKDAGQRFCKAVASWLEWEVRRLHLILQLPHTLFFPWNFTDFCFPELLLQLQNVDSFLIWHCLISNIFTVKTGKWTNIFRLSSNRGTRTPNASWQNVGVDVLFFFIPFIIKFYHLLLSIKLSKTFAQRVYAALQNLVRCLLELLISNIDWWQSLRQPLDPPTTAAVLWEDFRTSSDLL